MKSITVEKLLGNNKNYQQVTGNEESLKRVILTGEINRPGFELANSDSAHLYCRAVRTAVLPMMLCRRTER